MLILTSHATKRRKMERPEGRSVEMQEGRRPAARRKEVEQPQAARSRGRRGGIQPPVGRASWSSRRLLSQEA